MAQSSTIHTFSIELADLDRGVYTSLDLRVARHPSESSAFLVTRLLAYCLEYTPGIAFSQGLAAGDEPAIWVRDLTGHITAWIEIGLPDPERLHRGSKRADRVAVYTHRDVTQLVTQLSSRPIHRAEYIPVYAFDRRFVDALAAHVERRTAFALTVTENRLYIEIAGQSLQSTRVTHRIG